jgi:hypothetical protein
MLNDTPNYSKKNRAFKNDLSQQLTVQRNRKHAMNRFSDLGHHVK